MPDFIFVAEQSTQRLLTGQTQRLEIRQVGLVAAHQVARGFYDAAQESVDADAARHRRRIRVEPDAQPRIVASGRGVQAFQEGRSTHGWTAQPVRVCPVS